MISMHLLVITSHDPGSFYIERVDFNVSNNRSSLLALML